jgi:chemotaxis response regulator CheB
MIETARATKTANDCPVMCIGMSAGAVPPLKILFRKLSPHTDMAFVIIHHLR